MFCMNHFHSFLYVTFPLCFSFCEFFLLCWGKDFWDKVKGQGFSSLWFCRNLCSTEAAIQSLNLQWFQTLFYHKIIFQLQSILSSEAGEIMQENRSISILNQLFVFVGNTYRLYSLAWTVKTGKIYFVCVSEEKEIFLSFLSLHFPWSITST